jgi:S1-C subfamily serine protease
MDVYTTQVVRLDVSGRESSVEIALWHDAVILSTSRAEHSHHVTESIEEFAKKLVVDWNLDNRPQPRVDEPFHLSEPEAKVSTGSGFAVTENRDLVTNAHVVSGCSYVTASQGYEQFEGRVISSDRASDLAIVRLAQPQPPTGQNQERPSIGEVFNLLLGTRKASFARLRQSPPLKAGEQAISYGFPLSGALATEGNLTVGNVSALRGLKDDPKEIQVTTPFQAGNSGGPVLDRSGNVIGVAVAKLNALAVLGAVGDLPQNVNFAINIETLKAFLTKNKIRFTDASSRNELTPT